MFELWQWLSYAIGIGGGYDSTSSAISQKPQASSFRWLFIPDGPTWNLDLKHVDKMLTDGAYLRIWLHFLCNSSSLKLVRFMPEAGASWKLDLKKRKRKKFAKSGEKWKDNNCEQTAVAQKTLFQCKQLRTSSFALFCKLPIYTRFFNLISKLKIFGRNMVHRYILKYLVEI